MPQVEVSLPVPADANTVWQRFGTFQGIGEWHPMLAKVEGHGEKPGALRLIKSHDGQEEVEKLEEINSSEHYYRYSITSTPLPVKDYLAELRVRDTGQGSSTVTWTSNFAVEPNDEAKTVKTVQAFFDAGMEAIKKEYSLAQAGR